MGADYSINSGYVHWRKSKYLQEVGGYMPIDFGLQSMPTQPNINIKAIEQFLTNYASLQSIEGKRFNKSLVTGNVSKQGLEGLSDDVMETFEKYKNEIFLTGQARHRGHINENKGKGSHISRAEIEQIENELTGLITYLGNLLNRLTKDNKSNTSAYAEIQMKKIEFENLLEKTLPEIARDLKASRYSWTMANKEFSLGSSPLTTKGAALNHLVTRMEQIQQLFSYPSDEQYWRLVEKLVGNMSSQLEYEMARGKQEILQPLFHSADLSKAKSSSQMGMLSSYLYRSQENPYGFLKLSEINKYASNSSSDVLTSDSSSSIIRTSKSQQTTDAWIEIKDEGLKSDLGISRLKASIKSSVTGSKVISVVREAPLTTILELSADPTFLIHYMNIMSVPKQTSGLNYSDHLFSAQRRLITPYVKKLALARGLTGLRSGNSGGKGLSNVLFYTDGKSWKVYDSFAIVNKTLNEIDSMITFNKNYPINGIGMDWVPALGSPFLAARERVSKLYGDIHKVKMKVSLDLRKIT